MFSRMAGFFIGCEKCEFFFFFPRTTGAKKMRMSIQIDKLQNRKDKIVSQMDEVDKKVSIEVSLFHNLGSLLK